jgi:hypothetical protein
MNRIISSISVLAISLVLFASCEKKEILQDVNNLGRGSYVKSVLNPIPAAILDFNNLGAAKATLVATEFGEKQAKLTVYVTKGSRTTDRTKWKKVKEYTNTNGEYNLEVTGSEIANAMGAALAPGDLYTFYNSVETTAGQRFDFGNIETANVAVSPNYNFALTWTAVVVCPFTGNMAGSYRVVRDDWQDWSAGDIVSVTDGPAAGQVNISAVWPNPAFGNIVNPLYITVKTATGEATVPNNYQFADYGQIARTNGVGSGFVFSCTGDIIMTIPLVYGTTNFGNNQLILKRI